MNLPLSRGLALLLVASAAHHVYAGVGDIDWDAISLTTHSSFNAVNATGGDAYAGTLPVRLVGVLLNNPEDMLDATPFSPNPGPFNLGAQWQVYVQAIDADDFGGTAVFMGQHYGNMPPNLDFSTIPPTPDASRSYTNEAWNAELTRVNFDRMNTAHQFRAGDLVEIRAQQSLFYGGKRNANEAHIIEDTADFELSLITAGYGLPTPIDLELGDIWDGTPETGKVLFDQTREAGGEHYQASLVRLMNVRLVSPAANWSPNASLTVADQEGREFNLKLGLRSEFGTMPIPTGYFHITGIFDQEDTNGGAFDAGYRLWAMDPTLVEIALPGDYNADGTVNLADYTVWRDTLGSSATLAADGDGSLAVDEADYLVWKSHFGETLSGANETGTSAVPEPASMVGLLLAVFIIGYLRRA